MNTMRNRLTPSEEKMKTLRQAITPSQEKQNWMMNKAGKAANLTMKGVKSVGKGVGKVGKAIVKTPYALGSMIVESLST